MQSQALGCHLAILKGGTDWEYIHFKREESLRLMILSVFLDEAVPEANLVTEFTYINHYIFILIIPVYIVFSSIDDWKKLLEICWCRGTYTRTECYSQVITQGLVFHTPLLSLCEQINNIFHIFVFMFRWV